MDDVLQFRCSDLNGRLHHMLALLLPSQEQDRLHYVILIIAVLDQLGSTHFIYYRSDKKVTVLITYIVSTGVLTSICATGILATVSTAS